MGVKIADKLEQFNNGTYMLMDASAVEYQTQDGNSISVQEALDNGAGSAGDGEIIDDENVATDKTYSSFKIEEELEKVKIDDTLTTTDKTITGAINEVKASVDGITVPTKTSDLNNDSGFITSIPSEYITETELETKGYLTEHQDITGKADKTYVDTELAKKANVSHNHSYNDLTDKPTIPSVDNLATKEELTNGLATKANVSHTHDQYLTEHQDLSDYALKTDIPTVPTKTSQLTNDSGFITSVPSEYITETELDAKGYLTSHQDISNLALKSEIPDVSSFITSEDLPTVPTKVSDLENDSNFITSIPEEYITETELNAKGYLTSHQDISGLQPKTDDSLTTTDKTVIGAINELKTNISDINTGGGSSFSGSYND